MCRHGLQGCDRAAAAQLQSPHCRLSTVWDTWSGLEYLTEWCFYSCCCHWQETCGGKAAKLSFPRAPEHSGQYKHHLQSLQVVNPTCVQGVCQSHWLQVIQFLVITILETISRNEVCVKKRTKKGTTTTNRGNWGKNNTFKVLIYWISVLLE